jgi:hypothetical protein
MPWFVDFQKKYGAKKFAVVGVAMDDDGWKTLRPFLKEHGGFRYKMLAGDRQSRAIWWRRITAWWIATLLS